MALPETPLSQVCRAIAAFLADQLGASVHPIKVIIGSPADAVPKETDTDHRVNLFFYRLEPNEFTPAPDPDEIWRLRLNCLVTAFGVPEDSVSAGENALRLLGVVLRAFHERPLLDAVPVNGEAVRTQVVFQPLSSEEINRVWGTQGEAAYRPSIAYEMSLVPVLPRRPGSEGPLVGALGLETRATMSARRAPFGGTAAPPPIGRFVVDTAPEDWAPRICFVHGGACAESLSFAVGSPELAAFQPRAWVAGAIGADVELTWEVWDRTAGWRPAGTRVAAKASSPAIDPDLAATATTTAVVLPFTDHAGQEVLYAARQYRRASDGARLTVRSNPLLVNLFAVGP